jgi:hypothetical protein
MNDVRRDNPYSLILGLPEDLTEPDYYQLLALQTYCGDKKAIFTAIVTQYAKCLSWQNADEHYQNVKRIMEELSHAKLVLLDEAKKRDYDRQLKSGSSQVLELAPSEDTAESLDDLLNDPMMEWITDDLIAQVGDVAKQLRRSRRNSNLPPRLKKKRASRPEARTDKPHKHMGEGWFEVHSDFLRFLFVTLPLFVLYVGIAAGLGYMGYLLYNWNSFGQVLVAASGLTLSYILFVKYFTS